MKGKKLVIAVILALIVCLVLIPTCAFASEPSEGNGDDSGATGSVIGTTASEDPVTVTTPTEEGEKPTGYNTLGEAIDAAEKATDGESGNVKVDVKVEEHDDGEELLLVEKTIDITTENTITIDLGNNVLAGIVDEADDVTNGTTINVNSGNVTLVNGTILGRINVLNGAVVNLGENLLLHGYVVVGSEGGTGSPTVNVENCEINSSNEDLTKFWNPDDGIENSYYAISTTKADTNNPTINIKNGAYVWSADNAAIYLPSGTLNVEGDEDCYIIGATGIYMQGGNLNITNPYARVIGTGEKKDYTYNENGCNPTGDAIVIEYAYAESGYQAIKSVNIDDGNFGSEHADNVAQYVYESTKKATENTPETGFIHGGWFYNAQPKDEYLDAEAPLANRNDEIYAVGEWPIYVLAATANSGDVVTITAIPEDTYGTEVTIDDIDGVAGGVVIKNGTENTTIIINGVTLKPGESYTVPSNAASAPLSARYCVISGNNQQWTAGDLEFKLNSKDVVKVLIDGVEVEFTVAEDGTVTIASAVIEALESGTHEIEFVYADGSCKTVFTVK